MDSDITLSSNPEDYGLPFEGWYGSQKDACEKALNLDPGRILIVQAPTGTGKSGLPALVSYFRPYTSALTHSRDLQSQYATTLPMFAVIWGQDHYPCANPEHIADFKAEYGKNFTPTRGDCPFRKVGDCDYVSDCEYEIAKGIAMSARAKVLNYHYGFYSRWWRKCTQDLFLDEAHRLPVVLSDLISIDLRKGLRDRYALPDFPLARGGAPFMLKQAQDWSDRAAHHLLPFTKSKDIKVKKRAERLKGSLSALAQTLQESEEAEWYVESRPGEGFLCKPVVPGAFASSLLIPQARSIVLMSATIGDPSVLANELGIEDYEFVTYPHIFPEENRPVLFYKSAPRLRYRSGDKDYEKQVELIKGILKEHKGEKGIIHTASWSHAKRLAKALSREGRDIFVPEPRERVRSIERFKHSELGTVAISPSWKEGLDMTDDLARFCIIAKIPFLSLADPIVALRLKRRGGRAWYDWTASLAVVQGAGRIVRHPEDYGVTHIVDGYWPRVAKRAPAWFEWQTI